MSCVQTLRAKGLKLTPQRMLIVDIIHDAKGHLTADEIIKYVQSKMPGVNKSTIYRTLDLLEQSGCVYKSQLNQESIYHHAEEGHHHHLVCSKCGATIKCDEELFTPLKNLLRENHNFDADFKHIVINGLCEKCKNKD